MWTKRVILLADDSTDDVVIIHSAIRRAGFDNSIIVVSDGKQAIDYLLGKGPYADRLEFPRPDLLLLDLNMPRYDGFEVLEWVRKQPQWCYLPVIVLTASHYGADIERAYRLGANSFLIKPSDFKGFVSALRVAGDFWLRERTLPAGVGASGHSSEWKTNSCHLA